MCAPAGYGKTTTLAAWASTARGPMAWVSLDRDGDDPIGFCRRLGAAVGTVPSTADPTAPPEARRWVAGLLARFDRPPGLTLVIDDYHLVSSPVVHEAVTYLVEHLPPRVRLVIASRHPPPLPLARWRAQHRMSDVGAADLRLTATETAAFLTDVMGLPCDPATAGDLHTATEGWLAGLQLAGLALRRGVPPAGPAAASDPAPAVVAARTDLDTYLVTEVLDRLPTAHRDFLLRTSVLSRLTGPLCDALTGRTDGTRMLRELAAWDVFLVPLDREGRWYRYHHLFAAALATAAEHRVPEGVPELHRRAAGWHERYGDSAEAVEHALAAGERGQAARLMARLAEYDGRLWAQEGTAGRWLAALPEPVLAAEPVLCLLLYWVATRWTAVGAGAPLATLAADPDRWLARTDHARLPARLRGIRLALIVFRQFLDDPPEVVTAAACAALDALAPEQTGLRMETALRLVDVLYHGSPAELATRAQQELTGLTRPPHDVARRLDASLGLAMVWLLRGNLGRVMSICDRGAALAAEELASADADAYIHFALTLRLEVLLEQHRIAEAASLLAGSGAAAFQHPDPGVSMHLHRATAEVCLAGNDEPGALRALDELDSFLATVPGYDRPGIGAAVRRSVAARRAYACLALGSPADAGTWLADARGVAQAGDVPPGLALYEGVVAARLALAEQRPAAAAGYAVDAAARFQDVVGAGCHIRLRVVAALAHQQVGDREAAVAALAEALVLAGPGGYVRPFTEHGDALAPLLSEVSRRGRAGQRAVPRRLLDRVRRAGAPATGGGPPAPTLTARELEVLCLLAEGLSAPEAARRLGLAPATVRSHLERVSTKLDARTQAQVVARAYQLRLLPA